LNTSLLRYSLFEAATKEQLAEPAHMKPRFGDAPADDLGEILRAGEKNEVFEAMLSNSMESFVGVLAMVMGLDKPEKMN